MPLLAENVPERRRRSDKSEIFELKFLHALRNFRIVLSRLADTREIPLHIRSENGNTDTAECFSHDLQSDCLASASCAGDQAVAVRHAGQEIQRFVALRNQKRIRHSIISKSYSAVWRFFAEAFQYKYP